MEHLVVKYFSFAILSVLVFICCLAAAQAAVVEHTFNVGNLTVERLCKKRVITAVNGEIPGPTIRAHDGDTILVHLLNQSPYNITLHWHGIFQVMSGWADGPSYITQCPIAPGGNYTYRFNVSGQEGTLWWHAHVSFLRATVYGALIVKPRHGTKAYPFAQPPYKDVPIILGEWWDANVVDVENEVLAGGGVPNISDAFTINGRPGDLYPCSSQHTHKVELEQGEVYLFRFINAALSHQFFVKAAGHSFTVVAVDASYSTPHATQVLLIAPGQTVDALLVADAVPGSDYYLAARPFISTPPSASIAFNNSTTTALLRYSATPSPPTPPTMPSLPAFNDSSTAYGFYTNLTGLIGPGRPSVPVEVDESMFVTFGLGLIPCGRDRPMCLAASMNNVSFQFPAKMSLLEARYRGGGGGGGVYTEDFPERPAVEFDFTNAKKSLDPSVLVVEKGTKVKRVRYNATVEVILQDTAVLGTESHPIHLHGFNFFVLAQGIGNFNASGPPPAYNFLNPQVRNTVAVPAGGWAVIRFVANNPGVWLMHCHLDIHLSWGLAMAFEVDDGPTPSTTLPPPPANIPRCIRD